MSYRSVTEAQKDAVIPTVTPEVNLPANHQSMGRRAPRMMDKGRPLRGTELQVLVIPLGEFILVETAADGYAIDLFDLEDVEECKQRCSERGWTVVNEPNVKGWK